MHHGRASSSGAARASAAGHRSTSSTSISTPLPGYSPHPDVLEVRRLAHRHHDGDQPLRQDVPHASGCRLWSASPSGLKAKCRSRTSSCRPAPTSSAGTSANSATAPATSRTTTTRQPPRDFPADEVHRAAGRVQVRLRNLRGWSRSAGHVGDVFSEGKDDLDWVEQYFNATDLPKVIFLGEFLEEGLLHCSGHHKARIKAPRCAGLPKTASRTLRDWGPQFRPGDQVDQQGPADTSPAKSSSSPTASSALEIRAISTIPTSGHADVHSVLGRASHRASRSIRWPWCLRIRASASTPWATARTAS